MRASILVTDWNDKNTWIVRFRFEDGVGRRVVNGVTVDSKGIIWWSNKIYIIKIKSLINK